MSEYESSKEFQPQEISPTRRYYADMNACQHSYESTMLAIETFCQSQPRELGMTLGSLNDSIFLPSEEEFNVSQQVAHEKLLMLPLAHLGPRLDLSNVAIEQVVNMYDEAIKSVLLATSENHGNECLQLTEVNDLMCNESIICPYRFLERYTSHSVYFPDFSRIEYLDNPKRAGSIAVSKLNIGIKRAILQKVHAETKREVYYQQYVEYFNNIT